MGCLGKTIGVPDEVVKLIASFHHRMYAKIRLDGSGLEQIEVSNGLRQGCWLQRCSICSAVW